MTSLISITTLSLLNKSYVQHPTYADNVARPAFARRRCCSPAVQQSTDISWPPGPKQQTCSSGGRIGHTDRQTDGRTDARQFHKTCCAYFAGSVKYSELLQQITTVVKSSTAHNVGKGSPYSISERRVPELTPVLGSQPAGDVSHRPGGRLPLLSARPAVTLSTLKRAATSFTAW